jgi:hypothetical protein
VRFGSGAVGRRGVGGHVAAVVGAEVVERTELGSASHVGW